VVDFWPDGGVLHAATRLLGRHFDQGGGRQRRGGDFQLGFRLLSRHRRDANVAADVYGQLGDGALFGHFQPVGDHGRHPARPGADCAAVRQGVARGAKAALWTDRKFHAPHDHLLNLLRHIHVATFEDRTLQSGHNRRHHCVDANQLVVDHVFPFNPRAIRLHPQGHRRHHFLRNSQVVDIGHSDVENHLQR